MDEKASSQTKELVEINQIIDEIKEKGNLTGVFLFYQDGRTITQKCKIEIDFTTFAAMSASAIRSAQGLSKSVGNRKIKKITTQINGKTVFLVECGEGLAMALYLSEKSRIDPIFDKLDDYINRINKRIFEGK